MATIGNTVMTLHDWAKRVDKTGKTSAIAEVLNQTNRMFDDMMFKEGNLPTGEQVTIRTGLPTTYWRMLNKGTPKSKSTTAQVTEQCGIASARSEVDVDVAELGGDVNATRASESIAFMESMSQEVSGTVVYGSAANPEEIVGFANRYNDTSATNGQNIIDAGGTGSDNTSIWLTGWGENSVYGVFPKGSKAGIQHNDLGIGDAFDSSDNRFRAYMDEYKMKIGLVVKDWRYAGRIPNIDVSDLQGLTGTQAITASTSIIKLMSQLIDRLPSLSGVRPSFYANRTVLSYLRIIALEKSNSVVTVENALNQFGQRINQIKFLGIPVAMMDQITNAESQVT